MRIARSLLRTVILATLALTLGVPVALASGDPMRSEQYGLDQIRAPEAWATAQGRDTVIAIVDTGIDLEHPDLAAKLFRDRSGRVIGFDAVGGGQPWDENGHGTLVAGIAAAQTGNGIGIAGAAPRARLMPVRVLDDRGSGTLRDVDRGIRWAVDNGADVINLSLESMVPLPGQIITSGPDAAVRYAWERGVVVVAAAGNSGAPFTDYAASTPVLLVAATDRQDRQTTFSDSGRRDMVLAPGVDIVSTWCRPCGPDGTSRYGSQSGTSFAAPHVAAAVAILLEQGRSPEEAVARLRETAVAVPRPATSGRQGHGRIDVAAAVAGGASTEATTRERPAPERSPAAQAPAPTTTPTEPAPGNDAPAPQGSAPPAATPSPGPEAPTSPEPPDDAEGSDEPEPDGPGADDPPSMQPEPRDEPPSAGGVAVPRPDDSSGRTALLLVATAMVLGSGAAVGGVLNRLDPGA